MDMGYEDEPAETEIEEGAEEEEPSPTINNYGVDPATLSYVDSGGRLPGVVMPAVNHYSLEWPGSPVDLGVQSGTKKLREHDVSIVDSSVVGLGAGDSGVATMDGVEVLESSKGADLQRASRKSYADMVSAMRVTGGECFVCGCLHTQDLCGIVADSSEHVAVVSSIHSDQERPEELAFNEESLYEPWMVVDKCRRPPSRALTTNVEGTKRGGSRFAALSTVVEDVTPSRVTNLEVSNMRNLKKNGKLSAGANPLIDITNVPNKKDVGVTVISTIDGSVAHVMTHDLVIVAGSHKAFSIDEGNNENQTAARFRGSNQSGKGIISVKGVHKKNMKMSKKNESRVPPRPVLSEWIQTFSDHLDKISIPPRMGCCLQVKLIAYNSNLCFQPTRLVWMCCIIVWLLVKGILLGMRR
ncbi:hypothetical protein V6N13_037544 [Hibiscus sabdariffa]